jgi:FAD/FMN-containing dehydrogenase
MNTDASVTTRRRLALGDAMRATTDLEAIVGKGNVLGDAVTLQEYSGDLSFVPRVRPWCVVKPSSAAQVQDVVKWANATRTPLVPVSSGPPHFRGDTVPGAGGAVVVDLSGMKKIRHVDPINWVAMVEPGVTFGELQTELRKAGLTAYLPLAPRASKSVVGSMLEREPITTPNYHWDALDPLLCAEMVLGTGDMMRTGEAAGPDTVEEQWEIGKAQMNPTGPGQYDQNRLISGAQGTIGLVTWASLKCRPLPDVTRAFFVLSPVLEPLIDLTYQLGNARLGYHCFIVNGLNLACLMAHDSADVARLAAALPRWILVLSLEGAGPLATDKVEYQEADLGDLAKARGLQFVETLEGIRGEDLRTALLVPSAEPYWKLRAKGGVHELFFLTTLDQAPRFVATVDDLVAAEGLPAGDIGVYLQMTAQGTSCHCEFDLYYDPAKTAEVERTKKLAAKAGEDLLKAGAFFSRPYGEWAKLAYAQAPSTTILHRKIKNIFDPGNILNPGKLCF